MTIERGAAWGEPIAADLATGATVPAATDAEIAAIADEARQAGTAAVIELSATGGDVARTLGLQDLRPATDRLAFPFDLGLVEVDDRPAVPFVATVAANRWLWRGSFAVVANCGWWGSWYVGPRAHPNDGLLDVTHGALDWRQRLLARRRLPSGTHVPHPGLTTLRRPSWQHELAAATPVSADGRSIGRGRSLRFAVVEDCFTLIA